MLRLQQEKVLCGVLDPNCSYQPPWRKKTFYLMDGAEKRIMIVDESASPIMFNQRDPQRHKYLNPTAGLIRDLVRDGRELENIARNAVIPLGRDIPMSEEVGYQDPRRIAALPAGERWNVKLIPANPAKIRTEWEDVVRNAKIYSTQAIQIFKLSSRNRNDNQNKKIMLVDNDKVDCIVAQLPLEVWEVLVQKLDGITFLRVCEALRCLNLDDVVWEAYRINMIEHKLVGYWSNTCLYSMPKQKMNEIVTSFVNVITHRRRMDRNDFESFYNARDDHNCQDVVLAEHEMIHKIRDGELVVKNMSALEKKIKTNIQLHFQIDPGLDGTVEELQAPPTFARHTIVLDTEGSLCYYIINPLSPMNMFIMEDLDKCEERRTTIACSGETEEHTGILYTKIMYMPPRYAQHIDLQTEKLPEIDRLVVAVCRKCTTFRALDNRDSGCVYDHISDPRVTGMFHKMEPILAIHEDVFAIWHSPMALEFHQIKKVRNHYEIFLIQSLRIYKATDYWNLLCNYTQYFIPVLRKVRNSGAEKVNEEFIRTTFGEELATTEFYYELQLINMRFGTDTISMNNAHMRNELNNNIYFYVHHRHPQYFYHNALEERSLLDVCYSGCVGNGLVVFWNHRALAVSWDNNGLMWMFNSWEKALKSITAEVPQFADQPNLFVSQMCVCSQEVLAAVIHNNVVIFKAIKTLGTFHDGFQDEPKLIMEPIRLVVLDPSSIQLKATQFKFSFDKGEPYFLIVFRKHESKSCLDFWIQRLCFKLQDDEVEGEIPEEALINSLSTFIQEEERNEEQGRPGEETPQSPHDSFSKDIMRTIVGCKLVNLKSRVGLTDPSKTYSEQVDAIISGKANQGHFLVSRHHPRLLSKVQQWVDELLRK